MDSIVILTHGGAWKIPDSVKDRSEEGVRTAAKVGWELLVAGKSAVEAVEAAVVVLEDNPVFDAGRGSVLTGKGDVEMDAFIMDGANVTSGAVAVVSNTKNPVKLARYVMEETDHTLVAGPGADQLAIQAGLEIVDQDYLVTPEGREEWETYKKYSKAVSSLFSDRSAVEMVDGLGHDTVGAVALDAQGNVAAATSTGGITGKMTGRIGDTPLVGAGGYADNEVGAVSTTGHGESITKVCLAHTVINNIESGASLEEAVGRALDKMLKKVGGAGGLIALDRTGNWTAQFSTERMAWAAIKNGALESGIEPSQVNKTTLL